MGSVLDELFAGVGLPALLHHLGDQGPGGGIDYYLPVTGQPGGHFQVIAEAEKSEEVPDGDGRALRQVREVIIPRQPGLPFWECRPLLGGTFGYRGVEYAIASIEALTETYVRVKLVRRGVLEQSRPGYRRR